MVKSFRSRHLVWYTDFLAPYIRCTSAVTFPKMVACMSAASKRRADTSWPRKVSMKANKSTSTNNRNFWRKPGSKEKWILYPRPDTTYRVVPQNDPGYPFLGLIFHVCFGNQQLQQTYLWVSHCHRQSITKYWEAVSCPDWSRWVTSIIVWEISLASQRPHQERHREDLEGGQHGARQCKWMADLFCQHCQRFDQDSQASLCVQSGNIMNATLNGRSNWCYSLLLRNIHVDIWSQTAAPPGTPELVAWECLSMEPTLTLIDYLGGEEVS